MSWQPITTSLQSSFLAFDWRQQLLLLHITIKTLQQEDIFVANPIQKYVTSSYNVSITATVFRKISVYTSV